MKVPKKKVKQAVEYLNSYQDVLTEKWMSQIEKVDGVPTYTDIKTQNAEKEVRDLISYLNQLINTVDEKAMAKIYKRNAEERKYTFEAVIVNKWYYDDDFIKEYGRPDNDEEDQKESYLIEVSAKRIEDAENKAKLAAQDYVDYLVLNYNIPDNDFFAPTSYGYYQYELERLTLKSIEGMTELEAK